MRSHPRGGLLLAQGELIFVAQPPAFLRTCRSLADQRSSRTRGQAARLGSNRAEPPETKDVALEGGVDVSEIQAVLSKQPMSIGPMTWPHYSRQWAVPQSATGSWRQRSDPQLGRRHVPKVRAARDPFKRSPGSWSDARSHAGRWSVHRQPIHQLYRFKSQPGCDRRTGYLDNRGPASEGDGQIPRASLVQSPFRSRSNSRPPSSVARVSRLVHPNSPVVTSAGGGDQSWRS